MGCGSMWKQLCKLWRVSGVVELVEVGSSSDHSPEGETLKESSRAYSKLSVAHDRGGLDGSELLPAMREVRTQEGDE